MLYYILNPGRGFFLFSPPPTTPPPTDLRREEDLCSFWEIAGKWPGELHTVDCCRTMIPRKIRAEVLICVHRFFCFLRCNVNFFCLCLICDFSYYNPVLTAEMSHFHDQKVADFKSMMQHFIQEQIDYHQRVSLTKFA